MIKINKTKIPVTSNAGRALKYPFAEMVVGDSFSVPAKNYSALVSATKWAERNNKNWKFKASMSKGELTVWRIK